jgi:hypothetical protein
MKQKTAVPAWSSPISSHRMAALLLLIGSISLFSCTNAYLLPPFEDLDQIHTWVLDNIAYLADEDRFDPDLNPRDEWQTPKQTLRRRTGDCEDMASLIVYLAQQYLGRELEIHLLFRDADGAMHMAAFDGRQYFDAPSGVVTYRFFGFSLQEVYTLEDYLEQARFNLYRSTQDLSMGASR